MRRLFISGLLFCLLSIICMSDEIPSMPLPIVEEDTIVHSWLNKQVITSRLLDDMESMQAWEHHGQGALEISEEQAKNGNHSLKLTSPTFTDHPSSNGRPPGWCTALFNVDDEDWSDYNRLSFWVYPDLPGFRAISMSVVLKNEGTLKVPDEYGRLGRNFFMLKDGQWNHIVWEIAHLSRDKVTGVELTYRMQGNEPGATERVCYYLDTLELQTVKPDHFEGWQVAPGKFAYSHTGYTCDGTKLALANGLNADVFELHHAGTNQRILRKAIEIQQTALGEYQIMDFSEIEQPGSYRLVVNETQTEPFTISENVWEGTIWKTINCFYALRCGMEIPGIHGTCHEDWLAEQDGKRITFNGGWHDAGDLSQGVRNTCEADYAMFLLAEQLEDGALKNQLLEEAKWGLDWILKNRFDKGRRCRWGTMDFWTDNIIGTVDDMVTTQIVDDPYHNFHAVSAQAIAYRLLKKSNPYLADRALLYAREDWECAVEELSRQSLQTHGIGVIASLELYQSTHEQRYAGKAFELAEVVMACQQIEQPGWEVPLTGFFYRSPEKRRIQHYSHIGEIQSPVAGLVMLCELFPDHALQPRWRECVERYANYIKTVAEYTAPYHTFPASIYSLDESNNPKFIEQVKQGIRLSDNHYLRRFPVWFDFRGNYGVLLSQTRAISAAARLLDDEELRDLVQRQLQWVVGFNPFCQSTMYGEGHDFAPQYTATSGDIVGGLPVGIQTNRHFDEPFWPADNCYNFKEIWVHPSSRWLAIQADLYAR